MVIRTVLLVLGLGLTGCARLVGIQDLQGVDGSVDVPWNSGIDEGPARLEDAPVRDRDAPNVPRPADVADTGRLDVGLDTAVDAVIDGGPALVDVRLDAVVDAAVDAVPDVAADGPWPAPDAAVCPALAWLEATVSVYEAKGTGACSYHAETLPAFVAGIDDKGFEGAHGCGTCLRLTTGEAGKSIEVLVVERLAAVTGTGRQLSISRAAMDALVAPETSLTSLSFAEVPCAPPLIHGSIRIGQKLGSGLQHVEIMVRDSSRPLKSLELKRAGAWVPMALSSYNYWVLDAPGVERVYDFRLAMGDEALEVSRIALTSTSTQDGPLVDTGLQFSPCIP